MKCVAPFNNTFHLCCVIIPSALAVLDRPTVGNETWMGRAVVSSPTQGGPEQWG